MMFSIYSPSSSLLYVSQISQAFNMMCRLGQLSGLNSQAKWNTVALSMKPLIPLL